jgi:O-antigen/teichoic acid export membrane protein
LSASSAGAHGAGVHRGAQDSPGGAGRDAGGAGVHREAQDAPGGTGRDAGGAGRDAGGAQDSHDRRARTGSYGRGARVLSIGIASTGVLTFAYFSIASHVLGEVSAKRIDLLWSIMFVVISVIYRPIEQLLSRTIADRRARGLGGHPLRVPIAIQAGFAAMFAAVALALHHTLAHRVFDGYASLYWALFAGTLAYAASYFARGWLAGHERFALFGALVLMEAASRLCFALAVAVGIADGQSAVALGIVAAPFVSLLVVPAAFARRGRERTRPAPEQARELTLGSGSRFALAVSSVMLSEQVLLNAAILTVAATSSSGVLAGIVFNVLLIARAPLQLFQAIQTSLLPHLTGLEVTDGQAAFSRTMRVTVLAIAAFAGAVALALLAVGPFVMKGVLFGQHYSYGRLGLTLIGLGMGAHLISGALNQAALARNQAHAAAVCWSVCALAFLGWMLAPAISDQLLRTEVGYLGATALLAALLAGVYKRGSPRRQAAPTAAAIAR